MEQMRFSGWTPDVVISHSGWGCGLMVKSIWPNCRQIAYRSGGSIPRAICSVTTSATANLLNPSLGKFWLRNQAPR